MQFRVNLERIHKMKARIETPRLDRGSGVDFKTLQRLQANHSGQPVPPPAAVDIDVGVGGMDDQKEGLIGLVVLARHMLAPTTHST